MERLRVERLDGGPPLVIEEPTRLALDYFRADLVAATGYDAMAGQGDPNRITDEVILAINRFGARSPRAAWADLIAAGELTWLARIDVTWDLIELSDRDWDRFGCSEAILAALGATMGVPYRAQAVATKVLHLKRPRLFPILDAFVVQQIGGVGEGATLEHSLRSILHLRRQGQPQAQLLADISARLLGIGLDRSPVRVLDSLLWVTHPAAGSVARRLVGWERAVRPITPDDEAAPHDG